jgi:aldehyde dehydrogenase (NAD+)
MRDCTRYYVDGQWVLPSAPRALEVMNPATEAVAGIISLGSASDVDRAVIAAQRAFAHRARMNGLAALGKWAQGLEKEAA